MKVIIEHLEPILSKWLWIEYKHVSELIGKSNLIFTNVKKEKHRLKLSELGAVEEKSICELDIDRTKLIVLDQKASEKLKPEDFSDAEYVVVGGIMGDHPPRGRTWLYLTSRLTGAKARTLGDYQFAIDGAVYMALQVYRGRRIEEIPVQIGLDIKVNEYLTINLPYAYPLINGQPFISSELVKFLKEDIEDYEAEAIRTGTIPEVE